jgi:excisionase family DNA binding protein
MVTIEGRNYLTTREVAERLGLHPGTIRNQRCDGLSPVPWVKVGNIALAREQDVEQYARHR